ncbi:MAG: hypothetical protein ACTSQS_06960 [Promethearchaeota archaeon]
MDIEKIGLTVGCIIITIIIILSIIFWYVLIPIDLLIIYFYFRLNHPFPSKRQKIRRNYESLMKKAENLEDKASQYNSKKKYNLVIETCKAAKSSYNSALAKDYSFEKEKIIRKHLKNLNKMMCNAYIENGKTHNLDAKEAYKKLDIDLAYTEWNLAIKDFQTALDLIKSEKLEIPQKDIEEKIKSIKLNIETLMIKKIKKVINKLQFNWENILNAISEIIQKIYYENLSNLDDSNLIDLIKTDFSDYTWLLRNEIPQILKFSKESFDKNVIIKAFLESIPVDSLIKKGIFITLQNDQISMMRPVYGLNIFLKSWVNEKEIDFNLISEISKFLKNLSDYIDYSKKILKFIYEKGRAPEKDEAWDLDIPIDEMDLIIELINVKITGEVYNQMILSEKKYYYDKLKKVPILSKKKLDDFKLENLTTEFGFNLIDAKILPQFMNDFLSLEDLDNEIENYLNIYEITEPKLKKLNKLVTKIIKKKLLEKKKLSLLDISRNLHISLIEAAEALYFLNNSHKIVKKEFSHKEIKILSEKLSEALRYCHKQNQELNANLLISHFNLDLITANELIMLYTKKFELPEQLSKQEIKNLDKISNLVIKFIKEINENPTIDDLMINLNLNIRDASIIFSFINIISSEPLQENFDNYPVKALMEIDDISCEILKFQKEKYDELDLIDLAYKFNVGIYTLKRALLYISWIEKKIDENYFAQLSVKKRKIIEGKIKKALKYIKENNLELEFMVLIKEVGFNLKDTHLIIGLYNKIISREVDIKNFSENKRRETENLARKIYKAKKSGEISTYEPEEVFTLDINSASLDELWDALVYLKLKVLNILMRKSRIIKTGVKKISSEGTVRLKERYGTKIGKKEEILLSKEAIELHETNIKFKTSAQKVELKRGIDFIGGLIRYKIVIKNNTEMLINNVEISLQMTAEHIRIIDIKPKVYKIGDRAKISNISPGQSESIDFFLEPLICGSIPVAPLAIYMDAFGEPQMVTKEPLMVVSKCPLIINPGEENIAKVKNIYESSVIFRSFRSFELEHDPNNTFNMLLESINTWAGKPVSLPIYEGQDPFIAEAYYYVLNQNLDPELGHREQIIIKIRVDEGKNVAMLNVGAEKNPTVNGVLTHIWQLANAQFGETYGYEFISLHCPECGGSLDNMNKEQETIKCKYCGVEFEKRALLRR